MFGIDINKSEEDTPKYLFVHYICAISTPSMFVLESSEILKYNFRRSVDWEKVLTHVKRKSTL